MAALMRAANRGRVYECVRCEGTGRPMRNNLAYVRAHVLKVHLTADQCAEYCALCDYRASDHYELVRHTSTFMRHRNLVESQRRLGVVVEDDVFFRKGTSVYVIGEQDIKVYDKEQSRIEYEKRSREYGRRDTPRQHGQETRIPTPERLTESVTSVLPSLEEQSAMEKFVEDGEVMKAFDLGPKKPGMITETQKVEEEKPIPQLETESSSDSDSSESESDSECNKELVKKLEKNLHTSSEFIKTCFEGGQKSIGQMTAAMGSQTSAFLEMVTELRSLNRYFRDERDRREEARREERRRERQDRRTDRKDRPY